jgi:hypothetical protein
MKRILRAVFKQNGFSTRSPKYKHWVEIQEMKLVEGKNGRLRFKIKEILHSEPYKSYAGCWPDKLKSLRSRKTFKREMIYFHYLITPGQYVSDEFLTKHTGIKAPACRDFAKETYG